MGTGMTALVVGGGYVGRNLVKYLCSRKEYSTVRLLTRSAANAVRCRDACKESPKFEYRLGDATCDHVVADMLSGVDVVYNTAANKYIEVCERNVVDAVNCNLNTVFTLLSHLTPGVKFVHLSTDKVCSPSVYGASKLLAERLVTQVGGCVVRSGNVFGSDGSVIPRWRELLLRHEGIQLTDPYATRYFVTVRDLITYMVDDPRLAPGKILIPEMRKVVMGEMAKACLRVWGGSPDGDIGSVDITALRSCEFKHETLFLDNEKNVVGATVTATYPEQPGHWPLAGKELDSWLREWEANDR